LPRLNLCATACGSYYAEHEETDGETGLHDNLMLLNMESKSEYIRSMKTTIDIPDQELEDAMKFTGAKTKREAIVSVITEFNRRRRMAQLVKYSGSSKTLITVEELQKQRRKE
jgi:Arc/MetJ family transcription regulator